MNRYRLLIFILPFILASCISQSEYDKLENQNKQLNDTVIYLKKEIVELKYGADILLNNAKNCVKSENWYQARKEIAELIKRHNLTDQAVEGNKLLEIINNKILEIEENKLWDSAENAHKIEVYEKYLNVYPSGKYIFKANQRIKKCKIEMEDDEWQKAINIGSSFAFEHFLDNYPNSKWKIKAKKKLIDAKVNEIMNGQHGQLPSSDPVYLNGGRTASVSIENGTGYNLTVWYSGSDSKSVTISQGRSATLILRSGDYRVAASVDASNVRNYAGFETLEGGSYRSRYYISHSYY
jgi:hypothetical protein